MSAEETKKLSTELDKISKRAQELTSHPTVRQDKKLGEHITKIGQSAGDAHKHIEERLNPKTGG